MASIVAAIPALLEWATIATIAAGMISDALRLRIPHSICIAIVVMMPVWGLMQPGGVIWIDHLLGLVVAFLIGYIMWRLRWIGGGDVKYLAAIALWVGITDLGFYLVAMSVLGAILAMTLLLIRLGYRALATAGAVPDAASHPVPLLRHGAPVPYGIAIGLAAILLRTVLFDAA
jgi:prepilin peptidase CpaA